MNQPKPGATNQPKRIALLCTLAATLSAAAGCRSRSVVRLHDPSTREVVLIETLERTNYLVSATSERVFWACVERGSAFVCKRQCGEGSRFRCPSGFFLHHAAAPDVR